MKENEAEDLRQKMHENTISIGEVADLITIELDKLRAAEKETSFTRSAESDARNRYNTACDRLTNMLDDMKAKAPRDSNWGEDRRAGR